MGRRVSYFFVVAVMLLCACSYTAMPGPVPLVKGIDGLSLAGVSLIVTCAEKDASPYDILTDKGDSSGFQADRQAWSRKLVEALASELARRGAQIKSSAPLTLGVALPEIIMVQTRERWEFKVKVALSSSTGWSKNYEGTAGASLDSVGSAAAEADRLAGQALAEAVKAMLSDAAFLAQITGRS